MTARIHNPNRILGCLPLTVTVFTLALSYAGTLWLQALHQVEGAHEHNEPGIILHWLRDATLALPLVLMAVGAAMLLSRRLLARYSQGTSQLLAGSVLVATVAICTSVVMAAASPIHQMLFEAQHSGYKFVWYLHVLRDGLLALVANLALSAAMYALLVLQPWSVFKVLLRSIAPAQLYRHTVMKTMPALILVSSVLSSPLANVQPAVPMVTPGAPCPAVAPVRHFSVQAINVKIPLNRFGDNDPVGKMYVLSGSVASVRAQESSQKVSIGLRNDPIQPLVIRANMGDCVEIDFTNNASGGAFGVHIDGLAHEGSSSGDAIGKNQSSAVVRGSSRQYHYYIPRDAPLEGIHLMRPGPGNRDATSHGLFGALVVEPAGSSYLNMDTGLPLASGWEATIRPGSGKAFREYIKLHHEIGNEKFIIRNRLGQGLPMADPHTSAYRPGSRALNYRSEPFMNRLDRNAHQKSLAYNSYTFGDPATPMPRSYLGDPTKIRIAHAGTEMFHVYHLHGGGIRWRFNPKADTTYNYADTGLNKHPQTVLSPSARLDSQSIGPGESFNLEIEGGAGGVQQAVGDLLFHCHIAEHYNSGMWSVWRTYNTLQADLKPLPDRAPLPRAVDSAGLIGKTMPDRTVITAANLDSWIRPQLPPQGVPQSDQDASVWNWTINRSTPSAPVYLGEPEDLGPWVNLPNVVPGHPGSLLGDKLVGNRPRIMFDPLNGRPAFPLLRPHIGDRSPFSPNGHSGAPYLGEQGDQAKTGTVDPWANRKDGICPTGSTLRHFNISSIDTPVQVTKDRVDPAGAIFVLNKNKAAVRANPKLAEPLAIRGNIGDCIDVKFTTEMTDINAYGGFAKGNIHIHHVQFDPQGSDGASAGFVYDQSVRPYKLADPRLTAALQAGTRTLSLSSVAKFQPGVWIAIGLGNEDMEIAQIESISVTNTLTKAGTVTLKQSVRSNHPATEWAGTEFMQYRWYPDVELDNIFWHDHVDGIHGWGKGLVGQFIVEPQGSTYHDPKTGAEVDSGTIVDIHTNNPLSPGLVNGSFREMALWTIDEDPDNNPVSPSMLNLRAEPWSSRLTANGDSSLLFSSYTHGDPNTPLPRAYPGDPFVIRTINVGPSVDTLHLDGHRFFLENRYLDPATGKPEATPIDTIHYGISERFTLILEGGAGGPKHAPGDYLYMNGVGRRFEQGAWGLLRVLPGQVSNLQPLPGTTPPAEPANLPTPTGGRPPTPSGAGNPCPAGVPQRAFDVSAVNVPAGGLGRGFTYVTSGAEATAVKNGTKVPEPLVLHAAAGDCINVRLTNESTNGRVSFHVDKLERSTQSSGVNVGFNPEQSVAVNSVRTYRYYADTEKIGSALITDFGGANTGKQGLYGAITIAPRGATFTNPVTGAPTKVGTQVDVHVPSKPGYRDFTLVFSEDDPQIGADFSPYPTSVTGPALVNYTSAPRAVDTDGAFSSPAATPLLRAYAGDPVKVHALGAPGSEQMHLFSLGGLSWPTDPQIHNGNEVASQGLGPWETIDAEIIGGAGGRQRARGDFFYGDLRRPFTQAGMWGILRSLSDSACPIKPLDGLTCLGQPSLVAEHTVLSVAASAATVSYGGATTLSGKLAAVSGVGLPGKRVILEQRPLGVPTFSRVPGQPAAGVLTATGGTYRLAGVKPLKNTDYRARFAGESGLLSYTTSLKRVNVRVLVSVNTFLTTLQLGQTMTISGAVTPAHTGAVKVTIKRNGVVVATRDVALRSSRYRVAYKPGSVGRYTVQAGYASHNDHLGNVSPIRSFKVVR